MVYAWAVCLTLCFFGCGITVLTAIGVRHVRLGLAGSIGVAALAALGGVLNLLRLLTPAVLPAIVVVGASAALVALAIDFRRVITFVKSSFRETRRRPFMGLVAVVVGSCLLLIGLANANRKLFLRSDDLGAYLTFPKKTIVLGTVPAEPFSERRVQSSVGTNYFLEALMLPSGSIRSVAFVDVGFGYILLVVTAFGLFREYGISRARAVLLSGLVLLLPFLRNNLQMQILPCALFLSLALIEKTQSGWRLAVSFGVIAAAITGMKQSYLPAALLIPLCYFLLRRFRGFPKAFPLLAITASAALAAMLPWMIDSYRKEGTYFYPILGSGYHASAYGLAGTFSHGGVPLLTAAAIAPLAVPLLFLLVSIAQDQRAEGNRVESMEMCLAVLAGSAVSVMAIGYATSGDSVGRYSLPFVDAAMLAVLAVLFGKGLPGRWTSAVFILWCAYLAAYYGIYHGNYFYQAQEIRAALAPSSIVLQTDQAILDDTLLRGYQRDAARYQSVIPAGQLMIAAVEFPFPLDFHRNPIWLADFPGMASLPPGMPFEEPEKLRHYFLGIGVRYLVYRMDVNGHDELRWLNSVPLRRAFLRAEFTVGARALFAFAALKNHSRVLFSDGGVCVIDLFPSK